MVVGSEVVVELVVAEVVVAAVVVAAGAVVPVVVVGSEVVVAVIVFEVSVVDGSTDSIGTKSVVGDVAVEVLVGSNSTVNASSFASSAPASEGAGVGEGTRLCQGYCRWWYYDGVLLCVPRMIKNALAL